MSTRLHGSRAVARLGAGRRAAARSAVAVVAVGVVAVTLGVVAWSPSASGTGANRLPASNRPAPTTTTTTTTPPRPADPAGLARIVTPFMDMPNPFIMVANHQYYLYASAMPLLVSPQIQLRVSKDLRNWSWLVDALPRLPAWALWGSTWAPDVRWIGGRYVMYFTALVKDMTPKTECIGAATSLSPTGPFAPIERTLVCQLDHRGSIDPRTFVDQNGTLWLHWKSDDNADVAGSTHTTIYGQRLSGDGLNLIGAPATLFTADQPWEGRIVEAPQMVFANGQYWVFYSGNWFNEPYYAIGVARCSGPAGPCTKPYPHPFLGSNPQGQGPGESSLFVDRGQVFLAYGPWAVNYRTDTARPVAVARVAFGASGPYLAVPTLPTFSDLTTAATTG